jgi:acetyl-CoA carboxylase biotin carboxyl carrier protein
VAKQHQSRRRPKDGSEKFGMPSSSSDSSNAFDLNRLRELIALLNEHELGEIDLRQGDTRIRLRKQAEPPASSGEGRAAATGGTSATPTPVPATII